MNQLHDDVIDLLELFQTLWNDKWLISAFVALATMTGFGYSQFAKARYEVSVPYTFNIYSVTAHRYAAVTLVVWSQRLENVCRFCWRVDGVRIS